VTRRFIRREHVLCPDCGRDVDVTNWRRGDGSARRARRHKDRPGGIWCPGRFRVLDNWLEDITPEDGPPEAVPS